MENQITTISATLQQISMNGLKIQDLGHDTLIGAVIVSVATLLAAFIAVSAALKQIASQFEQKIVYEGWQDFQQKLFEFSSALMDYDTKILLLTYFLDSQENSLVNGGNKTKHRQEKWNEINNTYSKLQSSYIRVLESFENHEVIFLPLRKMKHEFQEEYRKRTEEQIQDFMKKLFPEMYGSSTSDSKEELKKIINNYWLNLTEISAFIDDFRIELQNLTVGKILNKTIPRRITEKGKRYKILTRKGFITQK